MPRTPSANEYFADFKIARTRLENMAVKAGMNKDTVANLSMSDILKSPRFTNEQREEFLTSQEIGGHLSKDLMSTTKNPEIAQKVMMSRLDKGDALRKKLESLPPEVRKEAEKSFQLERETMDNDGFQYRRGEKNWYGRTTRGSDADREDYFLNRAQSIVADAEKTAKDVAGEKDPVKKKELAEKIYSQRQASFTDANSDRNDADAELKRANIGLAMDVGLTAATAVVPGGVALRFVAGGVGKGTQALRAMGRVAYEGVKHGSKKFVATEGVKLGTHALDDTLAKIDGVPQFARNAVSGVAGFSKAYAENLYGDVHTHKLFSGDVGGFVWSLGNKQMAANALGIALPFAKGSPKNLTGASKKAIEAKQQVQRRANKIVDKGEEAFQNSAMLGNAADALDSGHEVYTSVANYDLKYKQARAEIAGRKENQNLSSEQIDRLAKQRVVRDIGYNTGNTKNAATDVAGGIKDYKSQSARSSKNANEVSSKTEQIETNAKQDAKEQIENDAETPSEQLLFDTYMEKVKKPDITPEQKAEATKEYKSQTNARSSKIQEIAQQKTQEKIQDIKDTQEHRDIRHDQIDTFRHIRGEESKAPRSTLREPRETTEPHEPHEPHEPRAEPHEPRAEPHEPRETTEPKETKEPKEPRENREPHIPRVPTGERHDNTPPLPPVGGNSGGGGTFASSVGSGFPMQTAPSYSYVNIQLPYFSELGL